MEENIKEDKNVDRAAALATINIHDILEDRKNVDESSVASKEKSLLSKDVDGFVSKAEVMENEKLADRTADISEGLVSSQDRSDDDTLADTSTASEVEIAEENKDHFVFLSEQIKILNGNDSDQSTRGIKRSQDSPLFGETKRVCVRDEDNKESSAKDVKAECSDNDEWEDCLENELVIREESDNEIDKKLEAKAISHRLSAVNVKSILHQIITNDHVVRMVRNTIENEKSAAEAAYEPKMTRSKVKQVLEKQGNIPHPWPMSPLKRPKSESPSFLDMTFSEDEEDEEYDPTEEKVMPDSDEDSESVMSSCLSDVGSPMPSTPSTSCMTPSTSRSSRTPSLSATEDSQGFLSPMGPPSKPLISAGQRSSLGRKFQAAMEEDEKQRAEEELIASRTRSKFPMTDTSLFELEANFVAPDITPDMYETQCDDQEWQGFLSSLAQQDAVVSKSTIKKHEVVKEESKQEEDGDEGDDEEEGDVSDPEYNYLVEEEEQEYDQEDFRSDKAVKVSRKELNDLMDELLESYEDVDLLDMKNKLVIKTQAKNSLLMSQKKHVKSADGSTTFYMTEKERACLDEQLRKHIQLLTQSFIMAQGNKKELQNVADASRLFINELHKFAVNSEILTNRPSAYKACILEEAVAIVNDEKWHEEKEASLARDYAKQYKLIKQGYTPNKPWEPQPTYPWELPFNTGNMNLPPLSPRQMDVIWNSPVFLYPELLPRGSFFRHCEIKRDRSRVKFLESEDNLLAIGMCQFKHLKHWQHILQTFLLPTKTKKQIQIRIKNLSVKSAKDNAVKYFKEKKVLPEFPSEVMPFDISTKKAPKDQDIDPELLPGWCKLFYESPRNNSLKNPTCRRRCSSVSLPTTDTPDDANKSMSAPATPLNATDTVVISESSGSGELHPALPKRPRNIQKRKLKYSPCKGGFVPLKASGIGKAGGRNSPLTVCVVDKMPISSSTVTVPQTTTTGKLAGSLPGTTPTVPMVTCVAPTIILINTAAPLRTPAIASGTSSVGTTPETVMSLRVADSVEKAKPNCESPSLEADTNISSPHSQTSDDASGVSSTKSTPVPKSAIEIMASYASYFVSSSPSCKCTPQQKIQETTPTKANARYRTVAPKPNTPPDSTQITSPFMEKPRSSPVRRHLKQQVRAILPKGFVASGNTYVSPTKKAASSLVNRVLHKGNKSQRKKPIMLKLSPRKEGNYHFLPRPSNRASSTKTTEKVHESGRISDSRELDDDGIGHKTDTASEYDTLESECVSDDTLEAEECDFSESAGTSMQKRQDTESEDTQSEPDDSQEEAIDDDHLANLMEASTTIRFDPRKAPSRIKVNRAKRHRDQTLAMLAPDLLESDPYKDERDTILAQAYLHKVKKALREDYARYGKFLQMLYEFGTTDGSPVKLYRDICDLLKDQRDLVNEFSALLLPEQAVECGCFQATLEFIRARTFLRKLKINFSKTPSHFQRIMKVFAKWGKKPGKLAEELREQVEPLLKGQHHLLEEFSLFFPDNKPPDSYMDDFEEVRLDGSGDEVDLDDVEEVALPDEEEVQGSKRCQCYCHTNAADDTYRKRKKHCYSCCLTVIDGELAYRVNKQTIKKVKVTFHPPVRPLPMKRRLDEPTTTLMTQTAEQPASDWLDSEGAEKENIEHYDTGTSQTSDQTRIKITSSKTRSPQKKKVHKKYLDLKNFHSWRTSKFPTRLGGSLLRKPVVKVPIAAASAGNQDSFLQTDTVLGPAMEGQGTSLQLPVDQGTQLQVTQQLTVPTSSETLNSVPSVTDSVSSAQAVITSKNVNPASFNMDSNSSSDILAKAVKAAMIGEGSMDSTLFSMQASSSRQSNVQPMVTGQVTTNSGPASQVTIRLMSKPLPYQSPALPVAPKPTFASSSSAFVAPQTIVTTQQILVDNPKYTANPTTLSSVSSDISHLAVTKNTETIQSPSITTSGDPELISDSTQTYSPSTSQQEQNVEKQQALDVTTSTVPSPQSEQISPPARVTPTPGKLRRIVPTPVTDEDASSSLTSPFECTGTHSPQLSSVGTVSGKQYSPLAMNCKIQAKKSSGCSSAAPDVVTGSEGSASESRSTASGTNSGKLEDKSGSSSEKQTGAVGCVGVSSPATFSEDAHEGFLDKFPSNQIDKKKEFHFKNEESLFNMIKRSADTDIEKKIVDQLSVDKQNKSVDQFKYAECKNSSADGKHQAMSVSVSSSDLSSKCDIASKSGGSSTSVSSSLSFSSTDVTSADSISPDKISSGESVHQASSELCKPGAVVKPSLQDVCNTSSLDSNSTSKGSDMESRSLYVLDSSEINAKSKIQSTGESKIKSHVDHSGSQEMERTSSDHELIAIKPGADVDTEGKTEVGKNSATASHTDDDGFSSIPVPEQRPYALPDDTRFFPSTSENEASSDSCDSIVDAKSLPENWCKLPQTVTSETVYTRTKYKTTLSVFNTEDSKDFYDDSGHSRYSETVFTSSTTNVSSVVESRSDAAVFPDNSYSNITPSSSLEKQEGSQTENPLSPEMVVNPSSTSPVKHSRKPETLDDTSCVTQPAHDSLDVESSTDTIEGDVSWDWNSDKVLLEICKELGPVEATFSEVSQRLQHWTPAQVQERFQVLMQLLAEESGSDEES